MKFKLLSLAGSLLLCAATRAADLTITDFGAVADGHAINTSIVPNIVMDQAEGPVFIRLGDRTEAYQTPSPEGSPVKVGWCATSPSATCAPPWPQPTGFARQFDPSRCSRP